MSRKLDCPVNTQMAVAAFRGGINGEHGGNKRMGSQHSGKRRVFVQTEMGYVFSMELDRSDNAHTVKRKLQLALDVPTEERSLIYGDTVLKNDLSYVRHDSPLFLSRNSMHRSSSTPCISPTGKDLQERDQSGPIEILGCSSQFPRTKQLVKEIAKAMKKGIDPIPVHSGLGGAYYFRNCAGENVAIVKPTDEEPYAPNNPKGFIGNSLGQPGLKRSVRVGETGCREVAAYLLDYDHFANVPCTALVKVRHSIFNINNGVNGNKIPERKQVSKIASLQQFIPHDFDASDHGTSSFPVASVHRIGILDVRILNTDRHAGNILVKKFEGSGSFGQVELVPIDHGLCLPENLEDPYFEWIHWPQASIPFSEDELEYINQLDPFRDSEMLRMELPMIREACLRVLVLCTIFLKEAAAFDLCLADIGEMMSREFRGHEEEPSVLESICIEAKRLLEESKLLCNHVKTRDNDEYQFEIDCEEFEIMTNINSRFLSSKRLSSGSKPVNGENSLYKLQESVEEEPENEGTATLRLEDSARPMSQKPPVGSFSKPSLSLKNLNVVEKSWRHEGTMQKNSYLAATSSGNTSVHEHLPASTSFVKLADLNEEEWAQYLEKFQKLLYPAFNNYRSRTVDQRQKQRLGTSCQF